MALISPILRSTEDNGLMFKCPGCNQAHMIQYGTGSGPRWSWNGDANKPTFSPSVLVRTGHYVPSHNSDECWCTYNAEHPEEAEDGFKCTICHSFITDGKIQFLSDCTHSLAGQTVPIPDWNSVLS